jgi:hypothetical protein
VYLSRENGWFTDKDGNEFYVRRNEKFPDSAPAVAAMPQIFDKISDDGPPAKAKVQAAVAKAKAAATGTGGKDG